MMLAYLFVVIAVLWRVLISAFNYPLGFAPVGAALLFFGARMDRKRLWIPLALLIGSDLYLTLAYYGYELTPDHFVTWAWYTAILGLGTLLKENSKPLRLLGASLTTSVSFFLVSNFAVWLVWNMYPKTWEGLVQCYVAAIPFFRNGVAGDLLFTALFFGTPVLVKALQRPAYAGRTAT
jgi:hypothetical protein